MKITKKIVAATLVPWRPLPASRPQASRSCRPRPISRATRGRRALTPTPPRQGRPGPSGQPDRAARGQARRSPLRPRQGRQARRGSVEPGQAPQGQGRACRHHKAARHAHARRAHAAPSSTSMFAGMSSFERCVAWRESGDNPTASSACCSGSCHRRGRPSATRAPRADPRSRCRSTRSTACTRWTARRRGHPTTAAEPTAGTYPDLVTVQRPIQSSAGDSRVTRSG